ncbi:aspartate kinase [Dysgonomonas sp. 216]|uniref:aspartate kinase n=1 Tax=Dysgonomonas sp. 216 TaxID=2302934 RepID=UPI0013D002C4|nr:aspartate kinase [Dysgonomonas sp. 216]NDW17944.1 aspartate kinase [Dysgonomonas sp. 216]
MLTVEKIGGTSMSQFGNVLNNIIIGKRNAEDYYNRIFVVSAYSNVTNKLLEHKKTGDPGVYEQFINNGDFATALDSVLAYLLEINQEMEKIGLDINAAKEFIEERIAKTKTILVYLNNVKASGYLNVINIHLAAREILASIGEAHSAWNSVNILNNNGVNAKCIDLSGIDDPSPLTIDERISRTFENKKFDKILYIVTGYTKGTEGIMREFDRGYSEVTFSKIAEVVKANEAIIHKEYHLSSADPNIVGVNNTKPVGHTNFIVADQLADIGMEAIHPKAAKPLEKAGINIRIKNTFEPEHPGTLISRDYISEIPKVEIISGTKRVLAIEVRSSEMVGEVGADLEIMKHLNNRKISYILKSTDASSITIVVWDKKILNQQLISDLKTIKNVEVHSREVAIVCAIGSNIAKPGFLARATSALANEKINVLSFGQSLRQVNMQFIIERNDYEDAIKVLNKSLCLEIGW